MISPRRLVVLVLLLGVAGTPGADAAACRNQIADPEGDAYHRSYGAPNGSGNDLETLLGTDPTRVYRPDVDILSGNVATGAKTVVAVLRVKTTSADSSETAKTIATWYSADWVIAFKIGGTDYAFRRHRPAHDGAYSDSFTVNGNQVATAPVLSVKQDATSITWTVPRALLPSLRVARPPKVLTEIHAFTNSGGGTSDNGPPTAAGKRYVDRAPSCVRAA